MIEYLSKIKILKAEKASVCLSLDNHNEGHVSIQIKMNFHTSFAKWH